MSGPAVGGPPPREIDVDAVVTSVLAAGAPELLDLPRRIAAEGWDNVLVRLGDELVLRLPRRSQAAELVAHEQRWLPQLAPWLPVAVPVPVVAGAPAPGYPWPWSVLRWREGVVAGSLPRDRARAWAPVLAASFAALHRPASRGAPHNPFRAVPLAGRDSPVQERFERGDRRGLDLTAAREVWRCGLAAAAWAGPGLWVHGDPHPNNLLVRPGCAPVREGSPDGPPTGPDALAGPDSLAALLDWGDLSAGDPACDLAAAWLAFDAAGRASFRATYDALTIGRTSDPGRWDRAAAWAVAMASSVVVDAPGDGVNRRWADAALREVTDGP